MPDKSKYFMKYSLISVFSFAVFVALTFGFKSTPIGDIAQVSDIQTSVEMLIDKYELNNSLVSCKAVSLNDNKSCMNYNDTKLLTPASILKLVTTSASLKYLGSDYTLSTKVLANGEIRNGVLYGDLILKGEGDATFNSKYFNDHNENTFTSLVAKLRNKGISSISGSIILDASNYERQAEVPHWMWQDVGNYYGAAVYALNYNDNAFNIYFNSKNDGEPAEIVSTSSVIDVDIENYVTAYNGRSDKAYVYSSPYSNKVIIRGEIPKNKTNFRVKASQPDLLNGYGETLKKTADWENQVLVSEKPVEDGTLLFIMESVSVLKIAEQTNKRSINLFAEQLFKHIGFHENGFGSTNNGLVCLSEYLESYGISEKEYVLFDGSGLSPFNSITANALAKLLASIKNESYFSNFKATLAKPDEDGTLKYFGKEKQWKTKIFGKTGTLSNSKSLAGYITTQSGNEYAFVFIINNFSIKSSVLNSFFEELLDLLYMHC